MQVPLVMSSVWSVALNKLLHFFNASVPSPVNNIIRIFDQKFQTLNGFLQVYCSEQCLVQNVSYVLAINSLVNSVFT